MRAGSGSWRTRAGGARDGSCRSRSPGWRRSGTAGRSGPTASRATAPGSPCRSSRRSSSCWPDRGGRRAAGRRDAVPAAKPGAGRAGAAARRGRAGRPKGCVIARWRRVPIDAAALGAAAAVVPAGRRPGGHRATRRSRDRPTALGCRVRAAPRPRPAPARGRGARRTASTTSRSRRCRAGRSSTRASSPAAASPRSTRTSPGRSRSATRSSTSATRRTPSRPGASPSRSGRSPTTARSTRSAATASRSAAGPATPSRARGGRCAPALVEAGPLLAPDGSDSQSLDEMLELLVATGWDLGSALLAAMPEASALRRAPHPHVATLRRRTAGLPRPVGRPGGDRLRRRPAGRRDPRPQRAPADGLRRDRATGWSRSRPRPARSRCRPRTRSAAAGSGPGEMLLVDPRRGAILEDAEAKAHLLRRLPIHDAPRPAHVDRAPAAARPRRRRRRSATSPGSTPRTPGSTSRRWSLEAHEPLWSMGDDTPTPGLGRVDRPVADHLRQSFAQVTNPPIDPERERAVMDLRVELGRRPALLGGPPRSGGGRGRSGSTGRSSPTSTALLARVPGPRPPARRDLGPPARARPGSRRPSIGWRPSAVAAARGRRASCSSSPTGALSLDRLPIPSVLAVGAVHTRAHRRRPPRPGRHPRRGRRRPRRPRPGDGPRGRRDGGRSVARGRAGGRAGRHAAAPRS